MADINTNRLIAKQVKVGGQSNITRAGGGGGQVKKKELEAKKPVAAKPAVSKQGGVATKQLDDGRTEHKADSGLSVTNGPDSQEIALPGGQKFKRTQEGITVTGGEAKDVGMVKSDQDLELLSFQDKDGNRVQVEPESMTYEVVNKQNNLAQVFHPDGKQEVVAFGTYRSPDGLQKNYQNSVTYDTNGEMVSSQGFTGLNMKAGKLSFDLPGGSGKSERTLTRPIQGKPESVAPQKTEAPAAPVASSAPQALLADTGGITGVQDTSQVAPSQAPKEASGPKLSPKQEKAAEILEGTVRHKELPLEQSVTLMDSLGVRANQGTGEAFTPDKKTPEGQKQLRDWRLGQIKDLAQSGRGEWAKEVAQGRHDHLAGKAVSGQLASDSLHSKQFQKDFKQKGWDVDAPGVRTEHQFAPGNLEGREVSFRTRNESGDIVQHQGVLQPSKEKNETALFTLKGGEGTFNTNSIIDMAVAPEKGLGGKIAGVFGGDPKPTAKVEPRIDTPAEIGPKPEAPSEKKVNQALLNGARNLPAKETKALLDGFGVKADQKTGDAFDKSLKGEQADRQNEQWQLGQVSKHIEAGKSTWAEEVAYSKAPAEPGTDSTVGFEARANKREAEAKEVKAHDDKFRAEGWAIKSDYEDYGNPASKDPANSHGFFAANLDGREVAFRAENSKGETVEHRGTLVATEKEARMDHFVLKGGSEVFHSNQIKAMAVAPEGQKSSKAGGAESPAPSQPAFTPSDVGDPRYTPKSGEPKMQILANKGREDFGLDISKGVTKTTESGVTVSGSLLGPTEIQLPGGVSVKKNPLGNWKASDGDSKDVKLQKRPDGLEFISVKTKAGHDIFIEPKSLTYEVRDSNSGNSMVYHPNGRTNVHRETPVVTKEEAAIAAGEFTPPEPPKTNTAAAPPPPPPPPVGPKTDNSVKGAPTETPAVKTPVSSETPEVKTPVKAETPVVNTPVVETPARAETPVVNTPVVETPAKAETPVVNTPVVETPAKAETPVVNTPVVETPAKTETPAVNTPEATSPEVAAPGPEATTAKVIADPNPEVKGFPGLTDIKTDFFKDAEKPGVEIFQTESGLFMRAEGPTRSFKLPNGDAFRTDGAKVETLGEKPTAKNARMVQDGDQQLLAYSDKDGNNWRVDTNNGDISVSNRQGTLTQGLKADGTESFEVRGTYTTESGKPQQYFNKATFGRDGEVVKLEGFKDISVSGKSLKFTLPNGIETSRNLIQPSAVEAKVAPKMEVSGGIAEGWGSALDAGDSLVGATKEPPAPAVTQAPVSPTTTAGVNSEPQINSEAPQPPPPMKTPSGMSRVPLPGGGAMTRMPNGITVTDAQESFATDKAGNRFEVTKTPYMSQSGEEANLLTFRDSTGKGYTLSDEHLDLMAQSKDGKVNQLVTEAGMHVISVNDEGRQHNFGLHPGERPGTYQPIPSPGVHADHRTPNKLYVDGVPNGGYDIPISLPTPPNPGNSDPFASAREGSFEANPGKPQQGVKPSMWDRFKSVFTGENPWEQTKAGGPRDARPGHQSHHQGPPDFVGGYHGSHMGGDPYLDDMRRMNDFNNKMLIGSTALTVATTLIPSLFFWGGGGYYGGF